MRFQEAAALHSKRNRHLRSAFDPTRQSARQPGKAYDDPLSLISQHFDVGRASFGIVGGESLELPSNRVSAFKRTLLRPALRSGEAAVLVPAFFDVIFTGSKSLNPSRTRSTFVCDIARAVSPYSDRPAASRASASVRKDSHPMTLPSRKEKTDQRVSSIGAPLVAPLPVLRNFTITVSPRSRVS